ncbi:MAG: YitT family protein [Clostridia bacterium]|nr:YitT family protein [Clostridia bacterium]
MDKQKKEFILGEIRRYFFMVVGCFLYALSLQMFLIPNKIVGGGVSGAASLIEIVTSLPAGLFIIAINAPILIFGFKLMGWKFILRCFITTTTLGLVTELLSWFTPVITSNPLLAAAYGGILQGVSVGFFIKYETSSGGTELLGRLTHHLIPRGSIATHVAVIDAIVVIVGAIVLQNPENILYALILIFISAKVSDMIVVGLSKAKMCYIITTKAEEISEFLIANSPRGVTLINGEGMFSKTPRGVLMTCIKSNQVSHLKACIHKLDENAFVIVTDANEVYGKGFKNI